MSERRRGAEARINAVEAYATGKGCRRKALIGYFGESLHGCSGCDRCRRRAVPAPRDPVVATRLARLRGALGGRVGPWRAALLEPEALLALARNPPLDPAALADVPGVGAALAARWGRAILGALGVGASHPPAGRDTARRRALEAWRRGVARAAGLPEYLVLRNAALERLAIAEASDGAALAAIPGLGPRALAKHGEALLRLIAAHPPGRYLLPMDQGDAEILERIDAGERVFRPGTGGERARPVFDALVAQLRGLRERGLIDMPDRSVAYAADETAGASLMAGPCYVTEQGREALYEFRRSDRRAGERRSGERRVLDAPALPLTQAERRQGERRRDDRRR